MSDNSEPIHPTPPASDADPVADPDAVELSGNDTAPLVTVLTVPVSPAQPEPLDASELSAAPIDPIAETIVVAEPNGSMSPAGMVAGAMRSSLGRDVAALRAETSAQHPPLREMPDNRGFFPTLLSTSVFAISFAVAVTITLYLIDESLAPDLIPVWWNEWKHIVAPVAGGIVALVAASLFALFNQGFTQPDRVDPQVFGELRARLSRIDAQLPVLCPSTGPAICDHGSPHSCMSSCSEAWARRDFINSELGSRGSRWVLGSGYIDLYRHLHAAEESLYLVQATPDVVGSALYDVMRLEGAEKVTNWQALQVRLQRALPLVAGAPVLALTADPAVPVETPPAPLPPPTPDEQAFGRIVLRDIRQAINEFRDSERANLIRARNQLVWTGTITAIAGYALLTLAVIAQAPPEAIISGVVYYVVGAGVGLFNQLRGDANRSAGDEDFGFSRARLFYTPVLSGLAAVGGVMVVSLLYEAVDFGARDDATRSLDDIFNVRAFGLGLVIAAVFGLTPDLLVDRLQQKADDYRAGLKGTSAAGSGIANG
jgi:hypothetical protein